MPVDLIDSLRSAMPTQVVDMVVAALRIYGNPWFYVLIAGILFLEHLRPAIREQRVFSRALAQDFIWFNLDGAFKLALLPLFVGLLRAGYDRVTGGFAFSGSNTWPIAVTALVAFLLSDFLNWFHHVVRHHVRAFWHFHVIHHAQRQLNLFTDLRSHMVEYLVAQTIMFIPLFMFPLDHPTIMGYGAVMVWYTRLIHANVRTNLGPLRHILVTPQFHRIHHSIEPRHHDRNFGVILTVWDRMFGTMYPRYDEYPETGVAGVDFEPPNSLSPVAWARMLWEQLVWPFRQLLSTAPVAGAGPGNSPTDGPEPG